MKIYKYVIRESGWAQKNKVTLPEGAKLLDVQWQLGSGIVMWALVEPEAPPVTLEFIIFNTGEDVGEKLFSRLIQIATVQNNRGIVSHIFLKSEHQLESI